MQTIIIPFYKYLVSFEMSASRRR